MEASCVYGRRKHWKEQDKANICQKGEDYGPWRKRLNTATQNMCSKYRGIQERIQPGAEIFKVDMEKKEQEVE